MTIEKIGYIPKEVPVCWNNGLHVKETRTGLYKTWCESRHECYGCTGEFNFQSKVNPLGYELFKKHDSMELIPEGAFNEGRYYMTNEEIDKCLQPYKDSQESFFWSRRVICDLDAIEIFKYNPKLIEERMKDD